MPTLLRQLPIPTTDALVFVGQEPIQLRAYQIIVWVSIVARPAADSTPTGRQLPAILDTGHSHLFPIQERHLAEWAGIDPSALRPLGRIRERGRLVPLRAAALFLHSNLPERSEMDPDRRPFRLETRQGIAVYEGVDFPRLPLLGLRALIENRLRLTIDGKRRTASLTAPPHWWPFG